MAIPGEALVGQPQVIGFSSRWYYHITICYILPEKNANILVRLIEFSVKLIADNSKVSGANIIITNARKIF